jgi:thiol-disulfide isomerase/thioredoxin
MRRLGILLFVLLMVCVTGFPREKTMTIGKCTWLTEQNSPEEVGAMSVKEKKPVLVVFSATWCKPCQEVKKIVFAKDEFKKVADKAVLLYIEQTDPRGMEYVKKYKVMAFPTFTVINKEGVVVDTGEPERTVQGFLTWMEEVEKGNTQLAYEQRLKKNPGDREALLKLADKFSFFQAQKKIEYFLKVIGETPDYSDPLTKKACEQIIDAYQMALYRKSGKEKEAYLKKCDKKVLAIFAAYLPDRFAGRLKGPAGYSSLMSWHITLDRPEKAVEVYENYMKGKTFENILPEGGSVHSTAARALLKLEKVPEVLDIYKKLKSYSVENLEKVDENLLFYFFSISNGITDYYLKKEETDKAKEMFAALLGEIERWEKAGKISDRANQYIDFILTRYAGKHDMFREEVLKRIDKRLVTAKGSDAVIFILEKAKLLHKLGKKEEAKAVLLGYAANETFIASIEEKNRYTFFNSLAWTLHELGLADEKALKIAEKSVALKKDGNNLDTLACIHADLGNYKKAVEIGEEAVKLVKSKKLQQEFQERIDKWKEK